MTMSTDGSNFLELIENERRERRQDIGGIHARIDQVLEAVNRLGNVKSKNGNGEASWVRQSVGLTIAVFSIISIMTAIIIGMLSPVNLNIKYLDKKIDSAEIRTEKLCDYVKQSIHGDVLAIKEASKLESERAKARLNKLEEWSNWWHKSLLIRDINERGRIID